MECIFKGIDTSKCSFQQKCAGIENLILQMGGSKRFALGFARYAFRTSILNKLKDNRFESEYNYSNNRDSVISKLKFLIYNLLDKIGTRVIGNPYTINKKYTTIENRVFTMEFFPRRYTPMEYCEQAGAGYGFFFYWAAIGSRKTKEFAQSMFEYGKKIGTIVTLRDMIKDYDRDKILHKYNPFHYMNKDEVFPYFNHNIQILQNEIQSIQNSVDSTILKKIPSQNAFDAVFRYALQSQSFCAKCTRKSIISSLNQPSTKTAASILASILVVLGINSACGAVAASNGGSISSILQESDTCCDRCTQRCAESCCQSCCDQCTQNCSDSCTCECGNCTCNST